MPKTRKKRTRVPKGIPSIATVPLDDSVQFFRGYIVGDAVKVRHVDVPTAEMQVFDERNLDKIETSDLTGKFVKVSPRVQASRRSAFPGQSIANYVKGAGALGVLISPTFVPDGKKAAAKKIERKSPDLMLDEWIEEQNIDGETAEAVKDTVLGFMDSEGL